MTTFILGPQRIVSARVLTKESDAGPVVAPKSVAPAVDPDRRLTLKPAQGLVEGSLRWARRPPTPRGVDARLYDIKAPSGHFFLTVAHYANGTNHPFEVHVHGAEKHRCAEAIGKLLSKVMHLNDPRFLQYNLMALKRVRGAPFELVMPDAAGTRVRVPSTTAAIAYLVEFRATELGYFGDGLAEAFSPLLAAMTCLREPKTDGTGGTGRYYDVKNEMRDGDHDDFTLLIKEAELPDGSRFPFSVWASGEYDREWDGVFKLLSLAMRLSDPKLIAELLTQLVDYPEHNGGFFADAPGTAKPTHWPSTLAYVAHLVRHRYQELGLLDDTGEPVRQNGLFAPDSAPDVALATHEAARGLECPECHAYAVVRSEGCWACRNCSYSKCS